MLKKSLQVNDQSLIEGVLNQVGYGALALCDKKPYSVPVNFVYFDGAIYFHSSPKGKKIQIIKKNNQASFNVVSNAQIIPSYYTSTEDLACPATSFFKSVIIDGNIEIVESLDEIKSSFTALMEKLQPEGKYKPFDSEEYIKEFKALLVLKINIESMTAKFKFGQMLKWDRYQLLLEHLKNSESEKDQATLQWVERFYKRKKPND